MRRKIRRIGNDLTAREPAMTSRGLAAGLVVGALILAAAAHGQTTRIRVGYTQGGDVSAAFVAREHAIFARHGLEVSLTASTSGSNLPAALMSGSFDIGTLTAPVLLLATAGGIDEVVVSGGSVANRASRNHAVVARPGAHISTPADFLGRRVAIAGFGGFFDLLFENWLRRNDVDPKRVFLVEMGQAQMSDALRGGSVDAVVAADPNVTRMVGSGVGQVVTYIDSQFPDGLPVILYAASRDWVEKHRDAATAFSESIAEATSDARAHPAALRRTIAAYTRLPPAVVEAASLPELQSTLSATELGRWNPILRSQGMLGADVDTARLLAW